ncbi:GNAT family N-acetyltransferase [Ferrimonas lipolytica]|uniref:N-acetyltransferase n=1 Tax=Ferrimonas lipolytica TaxID=2724191 RepID=A0A6H1UF96_9GAMM|nr:GNAT family N-acetyltransferase [Ferrimonas lipolytica]QIZ76886.1 N-acetyltransferase [Ferrimonas lipolytica]
MLRAEFVDSIDAISSSQWCQLFPNSNPFTNHKYLLALEQSGSVGGKSGWLAQHWLLWRNDSLIAAAPNYIKLHSYGEYLFDWAWAEAYQRHGLDYYPKLLCAIPYTPSTGARIGLAKGEALEPVVRAFSDSMQQRAQQLGASNAQLLFGSDRLQQALSQQGWLARREIQFHWHNNQYQHFEQFLARLTARKRKNIVKERQRVHASGMSIKVVSGHQIDNAMWQRFYHCYHTTYLKRANRPGYLSLQFFQQLGTTMPDNIVMIAAFDNQQKLLAAALCLRDDTTLYGRYWGALVDIPGLHFELCYYQGIEYCIKHGLRRFDPGAQGEHKIARGFEPTWVYGAALLFDSPFADAIDNYCRQELQLLQQRMNQLNASLPFKQSR